MAGDGAAKAATAAPTASSVEELLSALREDAERVLQGVNALGGEVLCKPGWQQRPRRPAPPSQHSSAGGCGTAEARRAGGRKGRGSRREEIHVRADDSPDVLLALPPALASRWKLSQVPPSVRVSDSTKLARPKNGSRASSAQQLDTRWRDAFVSNELVSDQQRTGIEVVAPGTRNKPMGSQSLRWGFREFYASVPFPPYSTKRLVWDLAGMLFMMYDMFVMPLQMSWGINPSPSDIGLFAMIIFAVIFWSLDIVVNLSTGFFQGGNLVMAPLAVFKNYLRGWMVFDVSIVALDLMMLVTSSLASFSNVRFVRVIRFARLARLAKLTKVNQVIEDACQAFGYRWLILVIAIFKSLGCIFFIAHVFACVWYLIGRTRVDLGMPSWLDLVDSEEMSQTYEQYIRCMYWVLGHLTAAPVDTTISPQNQSERAFTVTLIFCSLIVIGAGISGMTNTIAELGKLNSDFKDTKRQLQSYLKNACVNRELSTRILKFALHSYHRHKAMSLDASVLGLLSERLKSELAVTQRSRYFVQHPLFAFIGDEHIQVFRDLCEVFSPSVYADGDIIFQLGRVAKFMYVLHAGHYKLTFPKRDEGITNSMMISNAESRGSMEEITISETEWLCEICLYTKFVHQSMLQSTSFGDAFTLSCEDLLSCVTESPSCVSSVYRYAQNFLAKSIGLSDPFGGSLPQELTSLRIPHDSYKYMQNETQPLTEAVESRVTSREDTENVLSSLWNSSAVLTQSMSIEELVAGFATAFGELHHSDGVYAKLHHMDERNRAIASMVSLVLLLQDRYDDFIAEQKEMAALKPETWKKWHSFMTWVDLQEEQLHAVLVYLVVRGIGKMKSLVRGAPGLTRHPEAIVLHLMDNAPSIVPSTQQLGEAKWDLVYLTLKNFKGFSLPQLLQGENTPSQVLQLQRVVETQGEGLLKFYIVCQVAVMCGLGGARSPNGSSFMDEQNSTNLLTAISCLRQVLKVPCHQVYWGYILARSVPLGLPTEDPEQLAVARLACLCRTTPAESRALQGAWASLSRGCREVLASNLLADGVLETAFVFTFLPMYFANAKANKAVGMQRALLMLVDVLELLRSEGIEDEIGSANIVVDLQDVALFARDVQNPRIFLTTPAHMRLVVQGTEIQVMIATTHRERVKLRTWAEDHAFDVPGIMRKLERKMDSLEAAVTEPASGCRPAAEEEDADQFFDELGSEGRKSTLSHAGTHFVEHEGEEVYSV